MPYFIWFVMVFLFSSPVFGQKMLSKSGAFTETKSSSRIESFIDLTGGKSTISTRVAGQDFLGLGFDVKSSNTMIGFHLGSNAEGATVQLIRSGEILTSFGEKGGPNSELFSIPISTPVMSVDMTNEEAVGWPLVAAFVLCCVKIEVSYEDGWGGSIGWDCGCLDSEGGNVIPVSYAGNTYEIDEIRVVPNLKGKSLVNLKSADLKITKQ